MAERFQKVFRETGELPMAVPASAEKVKKRQQAVRTLQAQTAAARRSSRQNEAQGVPSSRGSAQAVDKAGRNDPCPCGSGKKYKKCHGKQA
jgi:uncharacterized protein YecA (UPF0149 family)